MYLLAAQHENICSNPFQFSVAFHMETGFFSLWCKSNEWFLYMKRKGSFSTYAKFPVKLTFRNP